MQANDYIDKTQFYATEDISGTGYLAYRDILKFIPNELKKLNTLDFGCGAGSTTRLLKNNGMNVIGVDISEAMLVEARKIDPNIPYLLIKDKLPFPDQHFHIIVSTLMLFEIGSTELMTDILAEVNRVLHQQGIAIFVTGSEVMYSYEWLSIFPLTEKKSFLSGEIVKIKLSQDY